MYDPDQPDSPYNMPGPCATESDACREWAAVVGAQDRNREWILTNYDTWERNPYYQGPPGRHPEDDYDD